MACVLLWLRRKPRCVVGIEWMADVGVNSGENWYSRPSELVSLRQE